MQIPPRNTHSRKSAVRITAPVTRPNPNNPAKQQLLLSYISAQSKQCSDPTTKDLFIYAGGTNREGEPPSGLDRLQDMLYVIHCDQDGVAIGLDIIPSRLYRSGVVPKSMEGVTTLSVSYEVGGAVAKIIKRPFNTRADTSQLVLRELDKVISGGKQIIAGMRLGSVGSVVTAADNIVEIRLSGVARRGSSKVQDLEDIAEQAE